MPTVQEVCDRIETWFPPQLAQSWDAVGLVVGRPEAPVRSILATVDVTPQTVVEALSLGVDMIVAHHPLLFGGVTAVAATDFKGGIVHDLIESKIALLVAHTNADSASPGVSDALAQALGVEDLAPLERVSLDPLDKFVVFVPSESAAAVFEAMSAAGAGRIGNYDRCAFETSGTGMFRPLDGADPHVGHVGEIEQVSETRLEMIAPRQARADVSVAMRAAHPYEEPAFDVFELAEIPGDLGLGRVGALSGPVTLSEFADTVAQVLPATNHGVRVAGEVDSIVKRVAVCGGSGDSLLEAANRADADVYVTSDLKHHAVSEHLADGGCAIIDVAHYASEFPWCEVVARRLADAFAEGSDTVSVLVSRIVTDPWTQHVRSTS